MDIQKSLSQLPQGIEELSQGTEPIEIVLEDDPDTTPEPASPTTPEIDDFDDNLAEIISDSALSSLSSTLLADIKNDINARSDWEKMYKEGVKLMGLKIEERTEPWSGACGVFHPIITEATMRFQADTMMETFPASGPAKTIVLGTETKAKDDSAKRVAADLNWQLTENMTEFRSEHERMLWGLSSAGSAFKKVYFDGALGRQTSVFVPAEDIILPYGYTDMQTCPRIAHLMMKSKADVKRLQVDGFWRDDIDLGEPPKVVNDIQQKKDKEAGTSAIHDNRYRIYEVNVDLDLREEDYHYEDEYAFDNGIPSPYVVTVDEGTSNILSIRRNWRKEDALKQKRQHFVHYVYIPGYGAYGFGYFHLLGGFARSATSIMRQLIDAGTLSNLPGGLKTRGLRIKGDDTPIAPGEFRDVDVGSGGIKDNIMTLPYKEPSLVLAGLLDKVVEEARRLGAAADMKVSDMSNQAPVGTTLALLERQLKVMSAVQARVHFSFKTELKLIANIIKDYAEETDGEYDYSVESQLGRMAKQADYSNVDVIPVSDPNAATMSQRVVQYQAAFTLSQSAPQIYDLPYLHRQMLQVLGLKNPEKIVPSEEDIIPCDPVQENQSILKGKPIKAFAYQDHESHIAVHMAAMTDPLVMQLIGQNPKAQELMAAGAAHVAEHVGYAYRNKMSLAIGMPLPEADPDRPMPPQVEMQLSKMLALAAPQVLEQSKQIVAAQQAKQNAQDPVLQAQLIDQQVKQGDLARKTQKDQMDYDIAQKKLTIEAQKGGVDPATVATDNALKVAKTEEEMRLAREKFQHQQQVDGVRVGSELAAKKTQTEQAVRTSEQQRANAGEQHTNNISMAQQRHREDLRMKAEAHKAAVKAKAAQAKAKPKTGGD